MADSADVPKDDNSQDVSKNDDNTQNEAEVVQVQNEENELAVGEEELENVIVLEEDTIDEMELEEEKEDKSGEKETAAGDHKKEDELEADDDLEMSVDNAFDVEVIDVTAGDDDDCKEVHEGDGEHEEMKDDDEEDEDEEEEEPDDMDAAGDQDPNVVPQVNVAILAQRKWQVKVYPLKPSDFVSGQISRVFKHARESLLYLLCPGRNARGKGEMYISSVNQAVRCVHSLMRLEYFYPEINVEIIKKNDEGEVEEKAYLRYDSKLTQMLTSRAYRKPAQAGRKRDRLIGSVFVKNLPPGTTKDTLRVMFPFAQEINYNPEKFKDCTARLVLHYRSHVIPCLKAFAKIELGGNVLELHPLTKRKRTRTDDENDMPDAKQKKSTEPKEETPKKKEDHKEETKQSPVVEKDASKNDPVKEDKPKTEPKPADSKNKTENRNQQESKNAPRNRGRRTHNKRFPTAAAATTPTNAQTRPRDQKNDNRPDRPNRPTRPNRPNQPNQNVGRERNSQSIRGNRGGRQGNNKSPARSNRGRQDDRRPAASPRGYGDDRRRDFRAATRRFTNNRNPRPSGAGGGSSSRQSLGNMGGRSSYGSSSSVGMRSPMTASDASLAINAEATKEMVLLQGQLSMAIKNQLAMLNQTQLAVEQAKRGASSIGLGSDMHSSLPLRQSPKALGAVGGSRRSVDQYRPAASLMDDNNRDRYDNHNRGTRPRNKRRGGGAGGGGYAKRGGLGSGGGAASNYSKRGGAGAGGSNYAKRGGAVATSSIGNYGKRGASGYRNDEMEDWDAELSTSQYNDPYTQPQDYVYDRELSSFGTQGRTTYSMDNSYSGYY